MSGKIYNKNLTFLQDQPFAEKLLNGFSYNKRRAKLSSTRDSPFPTQLLNSNSQSTVDTQFLPSTKVTFGSIKVRKKSEKMIKAETSLVKHFCLILERTDTLYRCESKQNLECSTAFKIGNVIPHLLVSLDSIQNTLLATRGSRPPERIKTPSQFKKILRECRKIRLLYGNLSMRHLSRATSKMRLPGENLLIWLESRLDVVLERSGFFGSVKAARQSVLNGKILVNCKVVRSPGFILEGGDLIKVIQKRSLFDSLNTQLSRGVILSNEVSPHLLRNKSLATALSKTLPKFNLSNHSKSHLNSSVGNNFRKYKGFDSSCLPVHTFPPYKSFYTWLLKKKEKNFQYSEYLGGHSKTLLATELQLKRSPAQNPVYLDKKNLSSKNWRFKGSPHLLFSFFLLHAHLQRVLSFITQTCKKDLLVDREFVKQKIYNTQNWNNASTQSSKYTRCSSLSYTSAAYRTYSNLPTISSVSKYCAINIFDVNNESRVCQAKKKVGSPIDTSKIELFFKLVRDLSKNSNGFFANKRISRTLSSQSPTVFNIHNSFGEGFICVLTEVYNNFLTLPWSNYLNKDERFSKNKEFSLLLSGLVIKDEKNLLCVLLSDLLLYSLLIKKEVACKHLKKEQLELNNQKVPSLLSTSVRSSKKQKAFDSQASPNFGFPIGLSRAFADNSRPLKVDYKKFNLGDTIVFSQTGRLKPLHLEVSYQSLCAVFLFPPQRICLPVTVDVDCLAKAF